MSLHQTTITCNDHIYRYYYLCPYLPLTAGADPPSRSLVKFKRGIQPDLDAWINNSLEEFRYRLLSPDTLIIRALRHDETQAIETSPTSLDLLGHSLAASFQCRYLPSFLRKSRTTPGNKGLTRALRITALNDVYSIAPEHMPSPTASNTPTHPPFLLIDDILTTGATVRSVLQTLQVSFPLSPVQIFTLAKAAHAC